MRSTEEALRSAYPQALATLTRLLGDLDEAQDVLHEAVERALDHWARELPDRPSAWLVRTARNIAIDRGRKHALARRHAARLPGPDRVADETAPDVFRDDMLRLIFTCCHPALSTDSQVALALRTVVGQSVDEIARAYLVPAKTMEQRLTRARRTLRDAEVPYEIPGADDLPQRLEAVCAVIALIFTDGYSYSPEAPALRPRLCELAIRLGRLLERLLRGNPEVSGLLALMLLQHSRWRARTADPERFVTLEQQDRRLWDRALIEEGRAILERALRRGAPGRYQIQAAIAAVHCGAAGYDETDWPQIVALYDALLPHQPTAVVRLNRAVAVTQAFGPERGLDALRELEPYTELQENHLFHAARGHVLESAGRFADAHDAYANAAARTANPVERRALAEKLEKLARLN